MEQIAYSPPVDKLLALGHPDRSAWPEWYEPGVDPAGDRELIRQAQEWPDYLAPVWGSDEHHDLCR